MCDLKPFSFLTYLFGDLSSHLLLKAGCDEIWEKICSVQGKDPSVDFTQVKRNGTFRSRNQAVLIPTVLFCYNILTFCAPGPGWGQRGWPRLRRDLRDSSSNWTSRSRTCQTWGSPVIQWLQSDCWSPKYQVQPSRDVSPILYCSGDLWIGVFLPVFAPEEGKACHCHRERQLHQEASQHLHCLWGLCFLSRPSFVCGIISRKCVLDVLETWRISRRDAFPQLNLDPISWLVGNPPGEHVLAGLGEYGGAPPPVWDLPQHLPAQQERALRDHVQRGDHLRCGRLPRVRARVRHTQEASRVSQING